MPKALTGWHKQLSDLAQQHDPSLIATLPPPPKPPSYEKADPVFSKLANIDPTAKSYADAKTKRDRSLGEDHYKSVFLAYKDTGDLQELATQAGITPTEVDHLLNFGIARLGLPPIREQAVNQQVVDAGLRAAIQDLSLDKQKPLPYRQMQEASKGATDRVTRETAAAQVLLDAGLKAGNVLKTYVEKLEELTDNGMISVGDSVDSTTISKLAKSFSDFARGIEVIVRLSQNTDPNAGQNTSMAQMAAQLISKMNVEEMGLFIRTKALPRHLRAGGGQELDNPTKDRDVRDVIDIKEEDEIKGQTQVSPHPPGPDQTVPESGD